MKLLLYLQIASVLQEYSWMELLNLTISSGKPPKVFVSTFVKLFGNCLKLGNFSLNLIQKQLEVKIFQNW